MLGRVLCRLGFHRWWPVLQSPFWDNPIPTHVCERCPAKRYGNRV